MNHGLNDVERKVYYDVDNKLYTDYLMQKDDSKTEKKSHQKYISLYYSSVPGIYGFTQRLKERFVLLQDKLFSISHKSSIQNARNARNTIANISTAPKKLIHSKMERYNEDELSEISRLNEEAIKCFKELGISEPTGDLSNPNVISSHLKSLVSSLISQVENSLDERRSAREPGDTRAKDTEEPLHSTSKGHDEPTI